MKSSGRRRVIHEARLRDNMPHELEKSIVNKITITVEIYV